MVEDSLREPGESGEGLRSICIREVLKDLKESSKLLIEDKLAAMKLGEADGFKVFKDVIQTPKDGVIVFKGMQEYSAESIKSLEKFKRAWVEEAQTLRPRSLSMLRPTIRVAGSEIWASWNPRRPTDAIDEFLRGEKLFDDGEAIVVEANWRDNPWFNETMEKERLLDLRRYPERYDHIWEGDYAKAFEGAYYVQGLSEAKLQGRIGRVGRDPLLPLRAFFDIGGAGAKADALAIWIVQWVGQEIRVLDYIEGVGQVLAYYVNELRRRKYQDAVCYLPHDGHNTSAITGKTYGQHLHDAGFDVEVIPNQGPGAAAMRIEATRRVLSYCWFNETTTDAGREALGFYHEKKDEKRNIGLGPSHDWASHCADAFGMMAICWEPQAAPMIDDLYDDFGYGQGSRSETTGY